MNGLIGVGGSLFNMWNSNRSGTASLEGVQNESFGNYLNSDFSSMLQPRNSYSSLNTGNLFYNSSNIFNTVNNARSNPYLTNYFGSNTNRGLGG
jgi:hypothetical protein